MAYLSIEVKCTQCEKISGLLVDREARNAPHECPECSEMAMRIWSVPHVSTEKTARSMPDVTGSGRFAKLRRQRQMQKELADAKKAYKNKPSDKAAAEIRRVRAEKKKAESKK